MPVGSIFSPSSVTVNRFFIRNRFFHTNSFSFGQLTGVFYPPSTTQNTGVFYRSQNTYHTIRPTMNKVGKWSLENMNVNVKNTSYAVRGAILDRAMELNKMLNTNAKNPGKAALEKTELPFDSLIYCNIGNPQSLRQQPITFVRQVLSLVLNPDLIEESKYPSDVIARAKRYLADQAVGAYSNSQGMITCREEVANFITQRDETFDNPANPENIFLGNGASDGVRNVMQSLVRAPFDKESGQKLYNDGCLVPIPQYPLYSALTTLLDGSLVPYYLEEESGWSMNIEHLRKQLKDARESGICVRGIVIINPGNPTGQVLDIDNMKKIVELCLEENIVLMADEVYQENIYNTKTPFTSFRKVCHDMGPEVWNNIQLISFHSVSKGYFGECGLRGGYFELVGIDEEIKKQLYKLASISLCSNTVGQMVAGMMCNLPKLGEPSYPLFLEQKTSILESLDRRSKKLTAMLNSMPGISAQNSDGAMYSFPSITLPQKFIQEAQSQGKVPDALYCMNLLEATGIVVVPGSGFGQQSDTWHFRTTFLPPEDQMDAVLERFKTFHLKFMESYK